MYNFVGKDMRPLGIFKFGIIGLFFFIASCFILFAGAWENRACSENISPKRTLKGVVIFSRHGVRVPHIPNSFEQYADRPWPQWSLPVYYLTNHGYKLSQGMGAYYSKRYQSILANYPNTCRVINAAFSRADNEQRTVMTAKALASGLTGKTTCGAPIFHMPYTAGDPKDSYFHPDSPECQITDRDEKESFKRLKETNSIIKAGLLLIQDVTKFCKNSLYREERFCTLKTLKTYYHEGNICGGLRDASSIAEAFLLQKAQGFPSKDIAWGKLKNKDWMILNNYHAFMKTLEGNNVYKAQRDGSNITNYLIHSLESIANRSSVSNPDIVLIVGHDTNFSLIRTLLGISWQLPEYGREQVPPAAAWMFEIYEDAQKKITIELFFVGQSLDQMNKGVLANTEAGHPNIVPVSVEVCGGKNVCDFRNFIRHANKKINKSCTSSAPARK